MIIITEYRLNYNESEEKYFVVSKESVIPCPVCVNESMFLFGWRDRTAIDESNVKIILVIRRLRCSGCNKIHHELPDFLIPYKRHCRGTIEKIIAGDKTAVCEDSTMRRIKKWWAAMQLYFLSVVQSLEAKHEVKFSEPPKVREIVRAVANSHLWIFTRSAYPPG